MRAFEANFQKTKIKSNQREVNLTWLWLATAFFEVLSHLFLVCLRVKKSSLHFKWFEVKSPPKIVHFVSLEVKNCWSHLSRTRGHGNFVFPIQMKFWQNWRKWVNLSTFMSPTFMQKCSKLYGFSLKHWIFFFITSQKISQKKLNIKTLYRTCIKRTHQSHQLWLGHFGMLWTQTEGVRLGI